jgi:hypothetical protein
MFDNELLLPTSGMPHDGLILTGADEEGIESPVSVSGEERCSYIGWFGFHDANNPIDGYIPDCKKDCTKDN